MKSDLRLALFVLALLGILTAFALVRRPGSPADRVHASYLSNLDQLSRRVAQLDSLLGAGERAADLQAAFDSARTAWKRVEFLAEHYNPTISESINGPAIPEIADDDPTRTPVPAEGFQVIEELLWSELDTSAITSLREELGILAANVARLTAIAEPVPVTDDNLFDAVRQELLRIAALGISGFDSPVAQHSLAEAVAALHSLESALDPYTARLGRRERVAMQKHFASAAESLRDVADFVSFDRFAFLVDRLQPLLIALQDARAALGIELPPVPRAWKADARSFSGPGIWNVSAFAPDPNRVTNEAETALGRLLFFDPILSGDTRRACSSCHQTQRAFTDGQTRSVSFSRAGAVARNAPGLINVGLQRGTFSDLRTTWLEDQVTDVLGSPAEMHASADAVTARIAQSPEYRANFLAAFGDSALTPQRVRQAVATYLRSLVALNSRFDRALRGDVRAVTAEERTGFNLFMGKAKCGTCHFFPLFNGTVPPAYAETDIEILSVPATTDSIRPKLDEDPGRSRVTGNPLHTHGFRTPTVRNIELTAPFMHNGVYRTLEEVVDFYDGGGGAGLGIAVEHQTLPPDSLKLSKSEKVALVAFMKALTDTTGTTTRPVRLPSFPHNPKWNQRPLGGAY